MKEHIYQILAFQRRKRGMSQEELALRAGLRREKVNRVESQARNIGFDELCRLLDAAGLELHVREKGENPPRESADVHPSLAAHHRSDHSRRLVAREFDQAAFIDGAKAKILSWGKVPR